MQNMGGARQWYGYDYPCDSANMKATDRFCPIKFVPFRGVNCSDAAGHEVGYQIIQDMLDKNQTATGRQWDSSVSSPWYNYVDSSGTVHQRWWAIQLLSLHVV